AKSAVAYTIKRLEEQVDFPILDSNNYRTKLTLQGEALIEKAQNLLLESDKLKKEIRNIANGVE
ncbi:hypothetical protein MHBO_005275, partial [Bonamia ostreae]